MQKFLFPLLALTLIGCGRKSGGKLDPDFARFVVNKRAQAQELADLQTNTMPARVWSFFDAVQRNDFSTATNLFEQLRRTARGDYSSTGPQSPLANILEGLGRRLGLLEPLSPALQNEVWVPIHETLGGFEVLHDWDAKWLRRFSRDIMDSIPPGSIYFGGTDPGRFAITAFSTSHREGKPFFTLTQNALADGTYLEYLRVMYRQLAIPTPDDSQQAFQTYLTDAQRRVSLNQLKPGEDVKIVENRVQVSGQVAVMQINGLLVKVIVEKNPTREIYVEESFPLAWMYPHLEPHGLIMKLNHEPLAGLDDSTVQRDEVYWNNYTAELIGDWLTQETSVLEICEFTQRVYRQKDLSGFKGDVGFARNSEAKKTFSKLRSAIGGLYAWRAEHANTPEEKARMTKAADFAFRQAFALCPFSPEAVFRFVNVLRSQNLVADAQRVAQTYVDFQPGDDSARDLLRRLQEYK